LPDANQKANNTLFGLAAGIWTTDTTKINTFANQVKSGIVWINTYNIIKYNAPFGGVKHTGFGRDLGKDALFEYLSPKTIVSKL